MPLLVYPTADFTTLTKISSSDMNGKLNAIKTLLNTTGLDDTNIQALGVSLSKLKQSAASTNQVAQWNGSAWAPATLTSVPAPFQADNLTIANSVNSNILTVALKDVNGSDPSASSVVRVGMRNITSATGTFLQRSISAALSQTLTVGTTLGLQASTSSNVWVYLIDSDGAGTMKLGFSSIRYDEGSVQSTVAESLVCTSISNASPAVITATAHGYNNNDMIAFTTSGTLPAGLSTGVQYFVQSATANTFQVAATRGGTSINTSNAGSGTHTIHTAGFRIASAGVYANVPIKLIARMVFSLATPGNWSAVASEIALGPIPGNERIAARYHTNSNQSMTLNTDVIFNPGLLDFDTHGLVFNPSTAYAFIAPTAGLYEVTAKIKTAGTTAAGIVNSMKLFKNGAAVSEMIFTYKSDAGNNQISLQGSDTISVAANDALSVAVNLGATLLLNTTSTDNWIIIKKINP